MIESILPTVLAIVGSIIATLITAVAAWLSRHKAQQKEANRGFM